MYYLFKKNSLVRKTINCHIYFEISCKIMHVFGNQKNMVNNTIKFNNGYFNVTLVCKLYTP